jgi:tripartite-type tricarboxylate transporter receptor subunit TctC
MTINTTKHARHARRALFATLALAVGIAALPAANAQDRFPSRSIRLVTQFGPGGATDLAERAIAEAMSGDLGQPVVVEGRPGAGGQIAVDSVRNAPADGYSMLFGGQTSLVNLPIIDPAAAGNPLADFRIVAFGTDYDLLLITGAASGIKTVKDLVERMKGPKGSEVNFAAVGAGTPVEMASLYLLQSVGAKAAAIPYKGPALAHPDLLEGRLTFSTDTVSGPVGLIKDKRMIALAVFAKTRSPQLPDVPTFAEAGFPEVLDVNWKAWNAVLVKTQTPQAIVDRLNEAARKGMATPKFRERVEGLSQGVVGLLTAREAQARLDAEVAQMKLIIPKMGIKPPQR